MALSPVFVVCSLVELSARTFQYAADEVEKTLEQVFNVDAEKELGDEQGDDKQGDGQGDGFHKLLLLAHYRCRSAECQPSQRSSANYFLCI